MIVFDCFHEGYDSWYETAAGAFVDAVETKGAFDLLRPRAGMKILDVGCGTGNCTYKLLEMGCDVTGIDISEKMLEQAREKADKYAAKANFMLMDGAGLSFADASFDAAISMAAFEFIPHPERVYSEMKRVVKPGGTIVIGTIQKGGEWAGLYESDICADTAYAHAMFKTKEDLISLDPENVMAVGECLYIPPGLEEGCYSGEEEEKAKLKFETGGFICVSYQRKR